MFIYRRATAAGLRAHHVRGLACTPAARLKPTQTSDAATSSSPQSDGVNKSTARKHTPIPINASMRTSVDDPANLVNSISAQIKDLRRELRIELGKMRSQESVKKHKAEEESVKKDKAVEESVKATSSEGAKATSTESVKTAEDGSKSVKTAEDGSKSAKTTEDGPESVIKATEDDPVKDEDLLEAAQAADAEKASEKDEPSAQFTAMLESGALTAAEHPIHPVQSPRDAKVARLAYELKRVLFSPGVHFLRDPRTGMWNFNRELGRIPTPEEFAFHRLPQYITASEDPELAEMAQGDGLKFTGSTSTLTSALSQIYFTLSGDKGVDISQLSREYAEKKNDFTAGAQLPACLVLRLLPNGRYAVDNNKEHAIEENVLSDYGRILEKQLTADAKDFARFLNKSPEDAVSEEERTEREAYCYSRGSTLLMRSQLDCQDDRLPGNGTFDIKTRACNPIRNDRANYLAHSQYDISEVYGMNHSFEREYYDLTRSGMLKYCFQARIGQMDGIFVAYHNTARYFGFQYLPLSEIDKRIFGSTEMAEQVFSISVAILERILDQATKFYPGQSVNLNLHRVRRRSGSQKTLIAVVQPTEWDTSGPRPSRAIRLSIENELDGEHMTDKVFEFSPDPEVRKHHKWKVKYSLTATSDDMEGYAVAHRHLQKQVSSITAMNTLYLPEGMTAWQMKRIMFAKRKAEEAKEARSREAKEAKAANEAEPEAASSTDTRVADEEDPFNMTGNAITAEEAAEVAAAEAAASAARSTETGPRTPQIRWMQPNDRIADLRAQSAQSGTEYRARIESWPSNARASYWWFDEESSSRMGQRVEAAEQRRKGHKAKVASERAAARDKQYAYAKGWKRGGRKKVRREGWRNGAPLEGARKSWKDRAGPAGPAGAEGDHSGDK